MNWIDVIIVIVVLLFFFEGLKRSFWGELLDLLSIVLAFFLSLRFYNFLALFYQFQFSLPHSLANVAGFVTVWFGVEILLLIVKLILFMKVRSFPENKKLTYISGVLSSLRVMAFLSILFLFLTAFPMQPSLKIAIQSSTLGSTMLDRVRLVEQPLKKVFGGITQDTLSFITIKPHSDETLQLGFATKEFHPAPVLEDQMLALVNKERRVRGIHTLTYDQRLRDISREHSADMFTRGYFSHYTPEGKDIGDRALAHDYRYLVIGENLAYAPSLSLAHQGLMNSPGHKANILSEDYNKVGIGIMESPLYGVMVTQVFSN